MAGQDGPERHPSAATDAAISPPPESNRSSRKIMAAIAEHPIVSGTLATVLGALVLAALAVIYGWLRPDPPATRWVEISNVRITDQTVTLWDFVIDYFHLPADTIQTPEQLRAQLGAQQLPTDVSDEALRTLGFVVAYDATFSGLVNQPCYVRWTVYDANTHQRLSETYLRDQPAFPHGQITPTAQEDHVSDQIWIPRPARAGTFFVRLDVFDTSDVTKLVPLASVESPPLT